MASSTIEVKPKRLKQGAYLVEREQSVRKLNTGRENRINLAASLNFLFAIIILLNVGYISYRITRPHVPAAIYAQQLSHASVITKISTVPKHAVPPPRTSEEVAAARLSIDPFESPPEPAVMPESMATTDAQTPADPAASVTDAALPK